MRLAVDNFRSLFEALTALFTGELMVEFAVDVSSAHIRFRNVGFAVIIDKCVNIWVRGNLEILIYPVFMPYRKIDMEIFGERVRLDEVHSELELFCVEVQSEARVQHCKRCPHFKLLDIFNVAALIDTDNVEPLCYRKLAVKVGEHLGRTGAKPYRVPSMTVEACLGEAVVTLVYIAVFGAVVAILASATHTLVKVRDENRVRTLQGRPTCDVIPEFDVVTDVKVKCMFVRIEFFSHKNNSVEVLYKIYIIKCN